MMRPFAPKSGHTGPAQYWAVMREAGQGGFRIRDIAGCTNGVRFSTVKDYVLKLLRMGAIERIGDAPSLVRNKVAALYRVRVDTLHAPVVRRDDYTGKRGLSQERVWQELRAGNSMTLEYLAVAASTEDHAVKFGTVREYVRKLANAGVVTREVPYAKGVKGRRPGARAGTYRLRPSANTGSKPPKIIDGRVFDPNLERFVGDPVSGVGEEIAS